MFPRCGSKAILLGALLLAEFCCFLFGSSGLERPTSSIEDGVTIVIDNFSGFCHRVNISVGTPPRIYRLLVDFEEGDVWLPSGPELQLPSKNCYDPRNSSTYTNLTRPFYSMFAKGQMASDVFELGKFSFVKPFGVAEAITDDDLLYRYTNDVECSFDGQLGLQAQAKTDYSGVDSFLWDMLRVVGRPIATVWFEKYEPTMQWPTIKTKGEITFGGSNSRHCADKKWVSTPQLQTYGRWAWAWHFDSVSVDSPAHEQQRKNELAGSLALNHIAEFSPNTLGYQFFSSGPAVALSYIGKRIGAWQEGRHYYLNCNESSITDGTRLIFQLGGGATVAVNLADLVAPSEIMLKPKKGVCVLLIFVGLERSTQVPTYPRWVFGTSFISGHCLKLNVKQRKISFTDSIP